MKIFDEQVLMNMIRNCMEEVIEESLLPVFKKIYLSKKEEINNKNLVRVEEASKFTGYKIRYLYNLVQRNAIPYYRIGNTLRFDLNELELWMKSGRPNINTLGIQKLKENIQQKN